MLNKQYKPSSPSTSDKNPVASASYGIFIFRPDNEKKTSLLWRVAILSSIHLQTLKHLKIDIIFDFSELSYILKHTLLYISLYCQTVLICLPYARLA